MTTTYTNKVVYSKQLATQYNTFHSLPSNFLDLQIQKIMLYLSLDQKRDIVLDGGCGSGRLLNPLAEKGISVIGVEKSKEMISLIPTQKI